MSVKYSYDKANNYYYLRKNGKKIASATTEEALTEKLMQLGKFSEVTSKSNLTVKDAFDSFLPYAEQNVAPTSYNNYKGYITNQDAESDSESDSESEPPPPPAPSRSAASTKPSRSPPSTASTSARSAAVRWSFTRRYGWST